MHRCKKCGNLVNGRSKFCAECKPIVAKEQNRIRCQRFRENHREELRLYSKKWNEEHPEEKKLHARNWIHRHEERCKQSLQEWRKKNPEKVKLQQQRARKKSILRETKRLLNRGVYRPMKWKIHCPECGIDFKTSAKRPRCACGYVFPRRFLERFIDTLKTKACKCCGREVPYQGRGSPRVYCDACLPQIMALKNFFNRQRYLKDHPEPWRKWEQDNKEVIVAMTCRACGNIILYKGIGKVPQRCELCRGIERSRPRPIWNPKDINTFISFERHRIGLDDGKKWTMQEILAFYEYWERRKTSPRPLPISYDDVEYVETP